MHFQSCRGDSRSYPPGYLIVESFQSFFLRLVALHRYPDCDAPSFARLVLLVPSSVCPVRIRRQQSPGRRKPSLISRLRSSGRTPRIFLTALRRGRLPARPVALSTATAFARPAAVEYHSTIFSHMFSLFLSLSYPIELVL